MTEPRSRNGSSCAAGGHAVAGWRQLQRVLAPRHRRGAAAVRCGRRYESPRAWFASIPAVNRTYYYWHVFVPGRATRASCTRIGSRAHSIRRRGLRFDPTKVLLDPYGRGVVVPETYESRCRAPPGRQRGDGHEERRGRRLARTTGRATPRCGGPPSQTIVYEMHVRGFTRHPSSGVPEKTRGTYAGLIEKIPYLQQLGITAVELLPVFQFDAQDCAARAGELLGLCARLILRAPPGLQLTSRSARGRRRVSRHGQGAAPSGHRGHSRRRLQPHRGRRPPRADPELPRTGQRDLLHARSGPLALRELQRHRQHAQRQSSHRPANDPGQPPLLGRARCTWTASGSIWRRSWGGTSRAR